ncbi:hypothetical protein MBLNU230_g1540t1 [Neophaeotheca triangularis]
MATPTLLSAIASTSSLHLPAFNNAFDTRSAPITAPVPTFKPRSSTAERRVTTAKGFQRMFYRAVKHTRWREAPVFVEGDEVERVNEVEKEATAEFPASPSSLDSSSASSEEWAGWGGDDVVMAAEAWCGALDFGDWKGNRCEEGENEGEVREESEESEGDCESVSECNCGTCIKAAEVMQKWADYQAAEVERVDAKGVAWFRVRQPVVGSDFDDDEEGLVMKQASPARSEAIKRAAGMSRLRLKDQDEEWVDEEVFDTLLHSLKESIRGLVDVVGGIWAARDDGDRSGGIANGSTALLVGQMGSASRFDEMSDPSAGSKSEVLQYQSHSSMWSTRW